MLKTSLPFKKFPSSRILRIKKVKLNTNILGDFQIYISVPLPTVMTNLTNDELD